MLLTGWLLEHAAAQAVEAPPTPRTWRCAPSFDRCGWALAGSVTDDGRQWLLYQITHSGVPSTAASRAASAARNGGSRTAIIKTAITLRKTVAA